MDKTPPQLDPKLKEAYDRVMGTVVTPPQHSEQAPPTPPPPTPEPVAPVANPVAAEQPAEHPAAATMVASPSAQPTTKVVKEKKKRKVSPIIIVLGVIIFLAIYGVVWVKYFGLTVPYLNP